MLNLHGPQVRSAATTETLTEGCALLRRGSRRRCPHGGVRVTEFIDLVDVDVDVATVRVEHDGCATFDNGHHPPRRNVHFHDYHNLTRPLHSGHDPGLRVLFPFPEHQL